MSSPTTAPGTQQAASKVSSQANQTGQAQALGNVVSGTQNVPSSAPSATTPCPNCGTSGMDVDKAVKHLDANAGAKSQGRYAHYVADAMQSGGVKFTRQNYAKNYGPTLEDAGFAKVPADDYSPQKGDVVVIQGYTAGKGHKANDAGHIAMYDGDQWVSDFKQGDAIYPGPGYRAEQPAYQVYRP